MKKSKNLVLAGFALLAITGLLALAGCKSDSVPETPAAKLVSISVTSPERTVYSVGQSFDPTGMVVTATYDDGTTRTVTGTITTDTNTLTKSAGVQTVTIRYSEGGIEVSGQFEIRVLPKKLTNYESPNNTDGSWTYMEFGEWPQSEALGVSPTLVDPQPENLFKGKYYSDANGEYVEKDGKYYKVEPIVWRVLNKDYASTGKALLLAESILTGGIPYYVDTSSRRITEKEGSVTVYPNNWQYSTIRAWLNGSYEANDSQDKTYAGKGFLQTAFTADAQSLIADTSVDNSAASTNPASNPKQWTEGENLYASNTPTTDKVFLLSEKEATTGAYLKEKDITAEDYGFDEYGKSGKGNTRIRVTTDYAKATGAYQDSTEGCGGWWWLRSFNYNHGSYASVIGTDGNASSIDYVRNTDGGVVPALSISLQ